MHPTTHTPRLPVALLAALSLSLFTALGSAARAQTVINSLPYTISTPGDYVLGRQPHL